MALKTKENKAGEAMNRVAQALGELWRAERPALPLWSPVLIGIGIQIYFLLPKEPPGWTYAVAVATPLIVGAAFWQVARRYWAGVLIVLLIGLGYAVAGLRAHVVAAPVLERALDATVEGRVVEVGRSASGRLRLVMDDLTIFGLQAAGTPERAQVTLLGGVGALTISPGDRVSVAARLGPPGRPVEPGGFDFRRVAWFKQLGAIGYARGAPALLPKDDGARGSIIERAAAVVASWRAQLSAGLRTALPGETGAIAAAVTVGDRGGVSPETLADLRASNLAHLLAISGLHMGLVTALVFGGARLALALIPGVGERWRVKRTAAYVALAAAAGYLVISGASIATQRAFVMAVVVLGAVILNRQAITFRALAVAALIILILRPESLLHVGFQMSFAATTAIVAGFTLARARGWTGWFSKGGRARAALGYFAALIGTSLLAGLATAPFGAFHFNLVSHYGLVANFAAVPVMGFWVAPAALFAAVLAPFGLAAPALAVMGAGIDLILGVAGWVAGLEGASRLVAAGPTAALAMVTLGGLLLALSRTRLRLFGAGLMIGAAFAWPMLQSRPALLVAEGGALMGLATSEGRALDHHSAQGYAASQWLRRDGDEADQRTAAARRGFTRADGLVIAPLANGWSVVSAPNRRVELSELVQLCAPRRVLIIPRSRAPIDGDCIFLGEADLARIGALSIDGDGADIVLRSAVDHAGDRLWTRRGGAAEDDPPLAGASGQ